MEQTKKLNMTAMSDKTNSNTTAKKEEPAWEHKVAMKVSGVSIAVNLLLSLFKLLAGILAHSGAMISDAIHSASDVGSTFVVIVGVNLSSKKSDKEHQYGHERMECVSSIILSGLLLATGIGIGMNGIENIIKSTSGASIAIPGTLALIAAVVSIVVKEWMFWYTRSAAKKINSGALMADAWHHRSDAMSSVGAFIGILGARLGFPILDPLASVAICILIVKASVDIFKDALKNNYPFEMNLEMTGFFETENGESDKFIKNAIAILYPYVRALISTYTANANINPLILPAINVNKLIENSEDKKD
mgnify:CR=1 FL=1